MTSLRILQNSLTAFLSNSLKPHVMQRKIHKHNTLGYRKIPKTSPQGLYFSKALFEGLIFEGTCIRRGLSTEANLRVKIDSASLIVGSKFTIFALFYFVFEGNFPSTSPPGGLYLERRFNGGFFALPVWGAYIWRGLFMERLIFRILWYVSKGCPNGLVVQWPMSPLQLNSLSHGTKTPSWRT